MSADKDPILLLVQLTEELWNEKKALVYTHPGTLGKKRILKRLYKLVTKIKALELVDAIKMECEFYKINPEEIFNEPNKRTDGSHGEDHDTIGNQELGSV